MLNNLYDVIIIGSGPAGYTAALYASRAFLKTLVIAGPTIGGQLTTTTEVHNFPGFPTGTTGPKLVLDMKTQAETFGTVVEVDNVKEIQNKSAKGKKLFSVICENQTFEGKSVIIATGASAKRLGIPSEMEFNGHGVSYCATCDGFFFRGKTIAVLGGGDTAMEEATFLTKFASHVTLIHRREEFRASAIMLDKAKKDPKISFLLNKTISEFYGETSVKGIKLNDNQTGKTEDFPIDGVFVAIGHTPATEFLKGFVELDEKGYIKTMQNSKVKIKNSGDKLNSMFISQTQTSVPGVFAAGDCVDSRYRQAIVAAGQGCMASIDAQKWLEE
jgi:thioredoxin reductase (NADPH)